MLHALTAEEARASLDDFVTASRRAVEEPGLDGAEIHGANGYLLHEFSPRRPAGAPTSTAALPRTGHASSSTAASPRRPRARRRWN
ncbi:hypothetical protein ACIGZH_23435 [Streptomyces sp. NPDC058319]|uniref:oxidoreductase n=1 Tax=unclassified Streptomyces TaxID=2593676 RepID=UPI0033BD2855